VKPLQRQELKQCAARDLRKVKATHNYRANSGCNQGGDKTVTENVKFNLTSLSTVHISTHHNETRTLSWPKCSRCIHI